MTIHRNNNHRAIGDESTSTYENGLRTEGRVRIDLIEENRRRHSPRELTGGRNIRVL